MVRLPVEISRRFLILALASLLAAIGGGVLSVLFYLPAGYHVLQRAGLYLHQAHSIHTAFSIAWIYLGGVAFVYHFLESSPQGMGPGERLRANIQFILWGLSGVGILMTLYGKIFSGREYTEYHPFYSMLIMAGWLLFAWNLVARIYKEFWNAPVYIYMWGVSVFLFIVSYGEGLLWLIPGISRYPIVDMQLQWQSIGMMVGSFNLLVYGAALYLAEQMTGDKSYAQSGTAFFLFGVGVLNSFTNYAHHTYHLPQSSLVKWISFAVSMLEIIILAKVVIDLTSTVRKKSSAHFTQEGLFLVSSKWWTFVNLALAILISVPSLNTLIHGTHVVVAHAMGATIGIDSLILFATAAWIAKTAVIPRYAVYGLNLSLMFLIGTLVASGLSKGIAQYQGLPLPDWMAMMPALFAVSGGLCAVCIVVIAVKLLRAMLRRDA